MDKTLLLISLFFLLFTEFDFDFLLIQIHYPGLLNIILDIIENVKHRENKPREGRK